jgi:hypothetical protein
MLTTPTPTRQTPTAALEQLAVDYRLPAPTSITESATTVTVRFDAPGWVTATGWVELIRCFLGHLFTGSTLEREPNDERPKSFVLTAHRRVTP